MFLWILIIAFLICLFGFAITKWDIFSGWFIGFMVLLTVLIITGIVILGMYCEAPGIIAANEQIYNSLTYQIENEFYTNANEVGKAELMRQITEWNKELAKGKTEQRNFWYGIFLPNIYDQFEYISLDSVKGGG